MCGRFYAGERFKDKLEELLLELGVPPAEPLYEAGGQDVFPSNASTVICAKGGGTLYGADTAMNESGREGEPPRETGGGIQTARMQWGFQNPYRKGLIINARAESAGEKALFKDSLARRRCIIPATGFYEWDAWKARYRFTKADDSLILLAGLWQTGTDEPRYTILTTDANRSMAPVHDRMPVMIEREEIRPWLLEPGRVPEFLGRPQAELICEQDTGQIRFDLGI
jgi:putative SOS response-associated peptidase YedK